MKKRVLSMSLAICMILGICTPAYAVASNGYEEKSSIAEDDNNVETRYITSSGVVVRVYSDKTVEIEEQDDSIVINGENYPLESSLITRGSSRPTSHHYLRNGPYNQQGTIVAHGEVYSDKLFSTSPENDWKLSFSGSASSTGGTSGEICLFSISIYNSQYELVEVIFVDGKTSLFGRISWDLSGTSLTAISNEVCYMTYTNGSSNSTSYNITVS